MLSTRRPDGHSFKAVDVIRNNFVSEDEYLIFDYCDGSYGGNTFCHEIKCKESRVIAELR